MKRGTKVVLVIVIILGIITLALFGVYKYMMKNDIRIVKENGSTHLEKNFTIQRYIGELNNKQFVTISENGVSTDYRYVDLGIINIVDNEDVFNHLIIDKDEIKTHLDADTLSSFTSVFNDGRIKNVPAKLEKENNDFVVIAPVIGNFLDIGKLNDYLISNMYNSGLKVDMTDFYEVMDSSLPTEEELSTEIEKIKNTYIEYTNGFRLNLSDYNEYLTLSGNTIVIDENTIEDFSNVIDKTIEKELLSYDNVGASREFVTHSGETITVSGGTYGNVFSSDKETEYIIEQFKQFKNEVDRIPIYTIQFPDVIEDTYVEVSIDQQHLWYYKNGELLMETDVVTGRAGGRDTPKGVYYVSECINGKYLTGDGYKTWVNKWMRLTNTGVGLHDAGWRGSFGGSIYKSNGSHGCINLPKSFAYKMFDEMAVKTPVIIY